MTVSLHPERSFGAFLFDMDGTILSSIAATERVWSKWASRYDLDLATFLPTIHGVRASETIARQNLPGVDPQSEAELVLRDELEDVEGIVPIDGAARFLAALPTERWAVVTSAPRELARRRLGAAGLPMPPLMVSGEDVKFGKPAPDCFLLAAAQLGQKPEDCLVFEDAVAGIAAAEAAGMAVAVVTATHSHSHDTPHPKLSGYDHLSIDAESGWLRIITHSIQSGA
ncbi:MAG: HAD-IA family hydrolase [Rhizobiaceae bacterium]|nr:HAD-IA family hydrolase [Rhizobiaceae bacterium]